MWQVRSQKVRGVTWKKIFGTKHKADFLHPVARWSNNAATEILLLPWEMYQRCMFNDFLAS